MHNAGFEAFGYGASINHVNTKLKTVTDTSKVKNVRASVFNRGSVDFRGLPSCANMGTINTPVMLDQQIQPYFKLPQLVAEP